MGFLADKWHSQIGIRYYERMVMLKRRIERIYCHLPLVMAMFMQRWKTNEWREEDNIESKEFLLSRESCTYNNSRTMKVLLRTMTMTLTTRGWKRVLVAMTIIVMAMIATSLKCTTRGWANQFKVYLYRGDLVMSVKELRVLSYVRYASYLRVGSERHIRRPRQR